MGDLKIGVMCHMFHAHLFKRFYPIFFTMPSGTELNLTTCSGADKSQLNWLYGNWGAKVDIIEVPNRGRDIAPKLITLAPRHADYDLVLHLHTKASNPAWFEHIVNELAGSAERVWHIIERFKADPTLGIIGPKYWDDILPWIGWGSNQHLCEPLLARMGVDPTDKNNLQFPAGSMFWARPAALKPIFDLNLKSDDFPPEPITSDGTLCHAVERLFYLSAEAAGYRWTTTDQIALRRHSLIDAKIQHQRFT